MTQSEPKFGRSDEELAAMPLTFRDGLFDGQVALVSGAGRGIGKAIAYQLARLGAKVALCGRDEGRLAATAEKLTALGANVMAHPMSIRDPDAVARLYDAVYEKFGALDLVVNNAGGQFPQAAIDFSPKGWNAVIDTNLNGTWYMMQAAAKRWRDAKRGGAIVNIVTVITRGMPGVAHTCAARAGVIYLSKTVAIEWAPLGIRINCVAPGAIATEGMNVYSEEARKALPRSNLMKRFGDVRDIADAVCYLGGPSGAFMTGEVVTVDGGTQIWGDQWTIPRPDWFGE
jgi:NAD(P)-dependent dehydrogenase (short-subunit alcohol dehydrogenase family)